ncbi:MAG: class I SAM-dependent methyltransferase [Alphaproteobacteria bacterium]|nr:class I SAM-dependent methyltransferase [Alphaproteobacteria bacterium]MBV9062148.1 class I SAM-dependent methyltransferase [Alphaproteobacteria bacterium]
MKYGLHFTAAALASVVGSVAASPTPPYITAAISDKSRPAEDTARDAGRKPAEMLVFAGIKPGDKIIELVPGKGYFTRIFAKAVGPSGHVYAFLPTELDAMMQKHNMPIPSGTDASNPNVSFMHQSLTAISVTEPVDIVWTSQNYHDMHDSFMGPPDISKVNAAIYRALKPGGTYVVLDHAAEAGSGLRDTDTLHRIDPDAVKKEVTAAGFVFVGEDSTLRNPADPHTKNVFDPSIRGKTDQFVFKFRKPAN